MRRLGDVGAAISPHSEEFDLTELSAGAYARFRWVRWAWLALALAVPGALALGFAYTAFYGVDRPANFPANDLFAIIAIWPISIVFVIFFSRYRARARPPVALSLTADSLEFRFESGRIECLKPTDSRPILGISVYAPHTEPSPNLRIRGEVLRARHEVMLPWRRRVPLFYLPKEALPALLAWARQANFTVEEHPGPVSFPHPEPDWIFYKASRGAEP